LLSDRPEVAAALDSARAALKATREIVELGTRCAMFVGFGRLAATWHMVADLPESFRTDGEVAPWGHPTVPARP
jgi:hypothetical protein